METGSIVDRRFEIVRSAGIGGMGQVFRAVDRVSGHTVALKVVSDLGESAQIRFARETRLLAQLKHPGIVRYVAHGALPDGMPYLVMEWIDGCSLSDAVRGHPLSVSKSIVLGRQLCDSIGEAHARGIVHRDLKPSNIILRDGRVEEPRVLDFGLARAIQGTGAITRSGAMVGTPAYMAPEQARNSADLDTRVDVFALGCVLYECLTGAPAFQGPNVVSVLCKVLLQDPPPLHEVRPEVPASLAELVARMLAKDPSRRPGDARKVREELDEDLEAPSGSSGKRSLGAREQRYISVILAGRPQQLPDERPTVAANPMAMQHVRRALAAFDASVEAMLTGALVVTLDNAGTATDRAAQAARCALALRDLMPGMPIVLATGRGMVDDGVPVGEAIDEASRLLVEVARTADSGDVVPVIVDGATANLLDEAFDLRESDGRRELLGYRGAEHGSKRLLGRGSTFVGRTRELAMLRAIWDECSEEGVARAAVVVGPPGIGKSRLRYELVAGLDESERAGVLVVRGDPMGAGGAFGLIGRLVRAAAGIRDDDAPEQAQSKLRARVERYVPADAAVRVTGFLAEMLGLPLELDDVQLRAARHDPVLRGDQIRRALLDWLLAESSARPLLLVLEDLQWGDLPTIEILDSALRMLADRPLMVLALGRAEVDERFPGLWADREACLIRLGPLRRRAASQLVQGALRDVDEAHVLSIVGRAGGNPFFLEELVRAEAEGRRDGAPVTVLAMLQARLDDLGAPLKRVLRAGSVFGDRFWVGGVAALLGEQKVGADLAECVQDLVEREILERCPGGRFAGEQELSFAHGLWRDAAYAALTDDDLALGHRLAAAWLEEHGLGEPLVLAEHYALGGVHDRAGAWYRRAAERCLEGGDLAGALEGARHGLEHVRQGDEKGRLLRVRAEAHKWRGENAEASTAAKDAMLALVPGTVAWYGAAGELAAASGKLGHVDELTELASALDAIEAATDAQAARVAAFARLATQLVLAGRTALADRLLDRLEAADRAAEDPAVAGWVFEALAVRTGSGDDPGARVRLAQRAAAAFEQAGDLRNACLQLTSTGFALNEIGDYQQAEQALRQAVLFGSGMGLNNAVSTARAQLGRSLARLGRWVEAEQELRQAVDGLVLQGNTRLEGVARGYLAEVLLAAGDRVDAAQSEARTAVEVLETAAPLRAVAQAVLAKVLLAQGRSEEALAHARDAVAVVERIGRIATGEGLVRLVYAEALQAAGQGFEAAAALATARERLEQRARCLTDLHLRTCFLEGVAEHARTLTLASASAQSTRR